MPLLYGPQSTLNRGAGQALLVAAPGQDGTNYDGGAGYSGGGAGFGDYIFGDGGQDGGDGEDGDGKGHGGVGSGLGLENQLIFLELLTICFCFFIQASTFYPNT